MSVPVRSDIRSGLRVQIVEKQNQQTGALTEGIVARILTKSATHPHGIKVMLDNGKVGRVQGTCPLQPPCSRPVRRVERAATASSKGRTTREGRRGTPSLT